MKWVKQWGEQFQTKSSNFYCLLLLTTSTRQEVYNKTKLMNCSGHWLFIPEKLIVSEKKGMSLSLTYQQ